MESRKSPGPRVFLLKRKDSSRNSIRTRSRRSQSFSDYESILNHVSCPPLGTDSPSNSSREPPPQDPLPTTQIKSSPRPLHPSLTSPRPSHHSLTSPIPPTKVTPILLNPLPSSSTHSQSPTRSPSTSSESSPTPSSPRTFFASVSFSQTQPTKIKRSPLSSTTGETTGGESQKTLCRSPMTPRFCKTPSEGPSLRPFGLTPRSKTISDAIHHPKKKSFCSTDHLFEKGEYGKIVECLLQMSPEEEDFFFVGFEKFEIDPIQLLEKMEQMIEEKEDTTKKGEIVRVLQLWNKICGKYYQSFLPSVASRMKTLLNTLEVSFSQILAWKGTNLMMYGTFGEVAQSLTSIMFQSYQNLQFSEFYDGAWEKGEKYQKSPNVMTMTHNFNRISEIVVESILSCEEAARRPMLVYLIKLAKQLRKMNNFEGVAAVMSGLNQAPIRRLKPLWIDLSSRHKRTFETLNQLISPEGNFKEYRNALSVAEPPLHPWLSPKLRELRYLYDGNQTTLKTGFINLPHLMEIGSSIRSFLKYQSYEYEFKLTIDKTALLQLLKDRSVSKDECYQKSLELYPRTPSLQNTPNLASHTLPDNSPQFSGSPFAPKTPPTPQGEDEEKRKREKEKEVGEEGENPSIEGTPVKQEYIDISHLPLGEGNSDISTPKRLTKKTSRKDLKRLSTEKRNKRKSGSLVRNACLVEGGQKEVTLECKVQCSRCCVETNSFSRAICSVCQHSFCFFCQKLGVLKNPCSNGLAHHYLPALQCSRCCVGTDSLDRAVCLGCQQYFCSSCQKLGALKNPCSNGRAHHYLPTEPTEPTNRQAIEKCSVPCSRCCVGTDSLDRAACLSCQQYFCSSCQKLGVLKNPCSNGRAHHYLPTEPTEPTEPREPTNRQAIEKCSVPCSRCCVGTDSLNRAACLGCQQYFCSSCQKLGVLKNPCSNGRAHFYLPTEPTEPTDKKK